MNFDLIHLAMIQACREFGDKSDGKTFNAACFSGSFTRMAAVHEVLDGNVVRAMLCGRDDVEILSGSSYFRMK